MKNIRLVEQQDRLVEEAIDWIQIAVGTALLMGLALAAPAVRALASMAWGLP